MKKRLFRTAFLDYLVVIVSVISFYGCTHKVYVPVERITETTVELRDTTVLVKIEKEHVRVTTPDTTAVAETSVARATATVSNGALSLELENKDVGIPTNVATTVRTITMNNPVPYPVEVIKKERYVAWYDKVVRWIGLPSFIILLIIVIRRKWSIGL